MGRRVAQGFALAKHLDAPSRCRVPAALLLAALTAFATPLRSDEGAHPTQAHAPEPAIPTPEILLMLVRTTLVALNQANFTGNYTVLHGLGSPALQARHNPAALSDAFSALRSQNVDMSPVLVLTPQLTDGPAFNSQGALTFSGYYPTVPLRIEFSMAFVPVDGRWRIEGLAVNTGPAPLASDPAPAEQ